MKIADPSMKFRIEVNIGIPERLTSTKRSVSGLEKPESYFVDLPSYKETYGVPDPSQIIVEEIDGVLVQGVEVQTGRPGWYKRVRKETTDVARVCQLTDKRSIDQTGEAMNRMESAAKKAIIPDVKPSKIVAAPSKSSSSTAAHHEEGPVITEEHVEGEGEQQEEEDDDEEPLGFLSLLRNRSHSSATGEPKPKACAKRTAAPGQKDSEFKGQEVKASKAKARAKDSKKKGSEKESEKILKTIIGNSNSSRQKRKTSTDADGPLPGGVEEEESEFSPADKAVLEQFFEKLKPFKTLNPPVAEAAWKNYFQEMISEVSTLGTEIRNKKKSAKRRQGSAEDKFFEELEKYDGEVKEIVRVCKCT